MKDTLTSQVHFGAYELDVRRGELREGDRTVLLQEQPFQILVMLVQHDGEIVTREEIQKRLWPDDTVVEFDQSINAAIRKLRKALGDSVDEPRYIRTVAKQGYRLIVPVERMPNNGTAHEVPALFAPAMSTAMSRRVRSQWLWLLATLLIATVFIAALQYWRRWKPPKLSDKDTIVIADFDNDTGDPVFDDTLKQALSAQLLQSPFLNVLSNREVREALKEVNRSTNEPLREDLARQVCQHVGSKAVLAGSISSLGKGYILGLEARDCSSNAVLAEAQEQIPDKAAVLNALDEAAVRVRKEMGEPLTSVQKYAVPSAEATIPSLEAWKAYTTGTKIYTEQGIAPALPFYKRALEIDPKFARVYSALSIAYADMHETKLSHDYGRKAYQLRDTVTERERFAIESSYYVNVTGELDKAASTYELWQQSYPKDVGAYVNFGFVSGKLGNLEENLEATREAMRLRPDAWIPYVNLAGAYVTLNRLAEAQQVYKQAEQRKIANGAFQGPRYLLAFLEGDKAQMAQIATAAMGKPGTEDVMLASEADTEGWYGRLTNARRLTKEAIDSAQRSDARGTAARYQAAAALREAAAGRTQQARADVAAARSLGQSTDIDAMAALALALAGDADESEKIADELDKSRPLDTLVQRYWLPTVRAAIALAQKQPNRAIQFLTGMGSIELSIVSNLCPVYVRGEAYLMLHDGKASAAEFQKFIDHYGLVGNSPWGALARLGLARAYALEAQTDPAYREKARTAYQNFLTLWKDADPEIPVYKQAKAEYAKLQ